MPFFKKNNTAEEMGVDVSDPAALEKAEQEGTL
jgi:hypothetical protein